MDVQNPNILIVDDDKEYALGLKKQLGDIGAIDVVHTKNEFGKKFRPHKYDLILLDLRLKEEKEGLDLLDYIMEEDSTTAVIVMSGYGDIATAVTALKKGARTFIEKRISPNELKLTIQHTIREALTERKIKNLESKIGKEELIGEDPQIHQIRKTIDLVAQDGETTVLIRGETGTGKELVARAIHKSGIRKDGPFISVALTDMNTETIISEIFGHEKGAFTGATDKHLGYFEQAHKGMLFIDEIGELPLDLQVKLLRVMDNKKFRRMGGTKEIEVDVQVITATNQPLEELIKEQKFRKDFYYRLNVFEIVLPPLRQRPNDITLLANYFLHLLYGKGRTTANSFSETAVNLMLNHKWLGNVRELKAVVESAAIRCKLEAAKQITIRHLSQFLINYENSVGQESNDDVIRVSAEKEIELIERALKKSVWKKTLASELLYNDRFKLTRRVKKFLQDYPDILDRFPEVKKMFLKNNTLI
ncbi:MAG: sigma-54 dependent transcriptional regulator [Nitrospirae bacterium YQR-1]